MRRTRYEAEDDYEDEWQAEKRRRAWGRQRQWTHAAIVIIAVGALIGALMVTLGLVRGG